MNNNNITDIFRECHPNRKRFSWRQFGGSKRSRLDYFLISSDLLPFVDSADIILGIASDPSMPLLSIDFSKFQRGRGFFKFNNSLLNDHEYVALVNDTIRNVTAFYAEDIYSSNFLTIMNPEEAQNITLRINPQLFLECLLLKIRGKTIGYCSWKKKLKVAAKMYAERQLESAEKESDFAPDNENLKQKLSSAKQEMHMLTQMETEAVALRARVKWHVEGEKPTKFFCNLEKFNAIQKYIPQLISKDVEGGEHLLKEQKSIDEEIFKYYEALYKSQEVKIKNKDR